VKVYYWSVFMSVSSLKSTQRIYIKVYVVLYDKFVDENVILVCFALKNVAALFINLKPYLSDFSVTSHRIKVGKSIDFIESTTSILKTFQ
jgi:hypothetical protein